MLSDLFIIKSCLICNCFQVPILDSLYRSYIENKILLNNFKMVEESIRIVEF